MRLRCLRRPASQHRAPAANLKHIIVVRVGRLRRGTPSQPGAQSRPGPTRSRPGPTTEARNFGKAGCSINSSNNVTSADIGGNRTMISVSCSELERPAGWIGSWPGPAVIRTMTVTKYSMRLAGARDLTGMIVMWQDCSFIRRWD
jgi:hypothetical protein